MDTNLNVDSSLKTEFIDESLDMLSGLETLFVQLEAAPDDLETVQAIFRPIHSIKGNSAFFGFVKVKQLAHEMETVLDLVRKQSLSITKTMIDVLLAGADYLRMMLERGRAEEEEVSDEADFQAMVGRVKQVGATRMSASELGSLLVTRMEVLQGELMQENPAWAARVGQVIKEVQDLGFLNPPEEKAAQSVEGKGPEPLQWLRALLAQPIEGKLPDEDAKKVGEVLQSLLELPADAATHAALEEALDNYTTFIDTVGFDSLLQEILQENLKKVSFSSEKNEEESPKEEHKDAEKTVAAKTPVKSADEPAKTMRVSEQHVDAFLEYVGELLVVRDMFCHIELRLGDDCEVHNVRRELRRINETFAALSDELQSGIMSIRLVPLKNLFQRVPRLVRDVASKSGKDIRVEIVGDTIEVDKSLIDLLDAPLTHLTRNAADHGIESSELREQCGKPAQGWVRVAAEERDAVIVLAVEDDGGGLDYDGLRRKAESIGLIEPGASLGEEDIVNLLFASGVSTATEITDVSGRGVGMDVVKRMVEESGGKIKVNSTPGKGTRFEVIVPKSVTTQIISGYLVETNQQKFVFPMTKVLETTRIARDKVRTIAEKGQCFMHHGKLLPLTAMRSVLQIGNGAQVNNAEHLVVTLAARQEEFGVIVDQVLGVQQVVLREISGLPTASEAIAGGALMGDGTVALVLDIDKLYQQYKEV